MSFEDLSIQTSGGFQAALPSPTCLMVFRLHPRDERMYLHMNCATVFGLLELLLGGKCGPDPAASRNLTEIEWSLLEEIVRVMVRPLGEAWQVFAHRRVRSGITGQRARLAGAKRSGPASNQPLDPPGVQPAMRRTVGRAGNGGRHNRSSTPPEPLPEQKTSADAPEPDARQKLALLEEAGVSLEVRLDGPLLPVADLMNLKPGQVIKLDHPLDQPLRGVVNGALSMEGAVVSSGKKRAFQVATLP